jgi:hypothetical protein
MESGPLLQEHRFTPEWKACVPCGKLIEADDWDGLATRVTHSLAPSEFLQARLSRIGSSRPMAN